MRPYLAAAIVLSSLLLGCPKSEHDPDYLVETSGDFWIRIQVPEESYEVGVPFQLGIGYGYDGNDDSWSDTVAVKVMGTALAIREGTPQFPAIAPAITLGGELRGDTFLRLVCETAGENQRIRAELVVAVYDSANGLSFVEVSAEVTTNCVGAGGSPNEATSIAMPVVEIEGDDYFQGLFITTPSGDKVYWQEDGFAPPMSTDTTTTLAVSIGGYGEVGQITEEVIEIPESTLETFCAAYAETLPSGAETKMSTMCEVLLVPGGGGGGGSGRGKIVSPCLAFTEQEAQTILGNDAEHEPGVNSGYSWVCSYHNETSGVDLVAPVYSADLWLERLERSEGETLRDLLGVFPPQPVYSADWVVINDSEGVFANDLAAGSLYGLDISQGSPNSALGDVAIMYRERLEGDTHILLYTVVGDWDLYLWTTLTPTSPIDESYVPGPIQTSIDKALDFAEPAYSYVLSEQGP